MQLFVIINNVGIKIYVDVNVKNQLIKEYGIKDLFTSDCECECDTNCDIGEYLDYENCKCRKKLFDEIIDECTESIEEVKLTEITVENENSCYKCSSCKVLYIILMIVVFTIFTGITIYFVYYNWFFIKNNVSCIKFNTRKETKI